MKYHKSYDHWLIILAKGEKIIEKLTEVCRNENIQSGFFSAIGAVNQVEMAHFDPAEKKYSYKKMTGALEIISLIGNITRLDKDDSVVVHGHISVSDQNMACFGGHLKEATVGVICEIAVTDLKITIRRVHDSETGLNLIQ